MNKFFTPLFFLFAFGALQSFSQAGNLDNTYDSDGKLLTPFGTGNAYGQAVISQSDGKIVVAGYYSNPAAYYTIDIAVARFNSDGTLDNTWDADGKVTTDVSGINNDYGKAVAIDADGKILVAGYAVFNSGFDVTVLRYNTDGSLDVTFDDDGIVTTAVGSYDDVANAICLDADGNIIVTGYTSDGSVNDMVTLRYLPDGTLDSNFGTDGIVTTDFSGTNDAAYTVKVQPDGKILVAGSTAVSTTNNFAVVRYNDDGTLDNTFSSDGMVTTSLLGFDDVALGLALQSDGKILVAGNSYTSSSSQFALTRYTTTGSLDNTFSSDGKLNISFGNTPGVGRALTLQPDGKIVEVGLTGENPNQKFALARVNADGTLDNSFSSDGKQTTDIGNGEDEAVAVTLQPDYKILAAGYSSNSNTFNFSTARYISGLSVGVADLPGKENTVLIYPNPVSTEATIEYSLLKNETCTMQLFDASGNVVQTFFSEKNIIAGDYKETLELERNLPVGNYLLVLSAGNNETSVTMVKE